MKKIISYIKLMRVKHWLKNGLVFLPMFFSLNLFNTTIIYRSIFGFFTFSMVASIVYIINDVNDIEKDKKHPVKKKRPLASGDVKRWEAFFIILVLLSLIYLLSSYYLYNIDNNSMVYIIPFIYFLINVLYSIGMKNIPIIDVVILVFGFVTRVAYGGIVTNIEVSKYLYLMIIFGSFFLGFGKRRNEIKKNGNKSRKVLAKYNKEFLDKNMYVSLALALVSYTLWCVDISTITRIGNDWLFVTIPIVYVVFQLYSLDIEGDSFGDPIEVVLSNKLLVSTIILYIISLFIILYII